jgi:tRNA pseudouridine55 synthase
MLGGVKAGHAGTLDPLASGLLVCALGNATRLLSYLPDEPKKYAFGIRFGSETDTLDSDGSVVAHGGAVPKKKELQAVLGRFCGTILQTPPKFSAVKIQGERAYDLARQNREFEIAERTVTVFSLTLLSYNEGGAEASLETECSGGTYVRSLCRDIAHALGTYGYASCIRRLAVGPFGVDKAIDIEKVMELSPHIIPVDRALESLPSVTITAEQCKALSNGRDIKVHMTDKIVMAYTNNGDCAAVLSSNTDMLYHPEKVFLKG